MSIFAELKRRSACKVAVAGGAYAFERIFVAEIKGNTPAHHASEKAISRSPAWEAGQRV